ncbi:MAG: hypothetical protein EOO10_12035 [Chitinophagaceae bacterium]|nr:MAG: hypothetical protein EOO10_12035 [Chitinophagaceae bacterium]
MLQMKRLLMLSVIACLFITSCKKELSPSDQISTQTLQVKGTELQGNANNALGNLKASNPLLQKGRIEEIYKLLIKQRYKQVSPTPCNSSTPLQTWLDNQFADWTLQSWNNAFGYALLDLPGDYAYLFENSSANQTFGTRGEYNQIMAKTFKDLNRFFNMESVGIVLAAMHGTTMLDKEKVSKILYAFYVPTQELADYYANVVVDLVRSSPEYRNGNHPIFTFNAFAAPENDLTQFGYGILPNKIVMGDGILDGYSAIGFSDVAPQAILAHEMAHHVQFKENVQFYQTSESARRTELMADAFAAYYLSHAKGAAMQWKRVKQFLQVFFNIGDCAFNSSGHHGTPTQRMAAAEWAYNLGNSAQKQGHIISSAQFIALFDAVLPSLTSQ